MALREGPKISDRRVSNAALANAALVLSSKNWKNIQNEGQRQKINPKSLGSVVSLCCRAGIDAALVKADFFFAGAGVPTIEDKIEQKFKTLRWRLLRWRLTLSKVRKIISAENVFRENVISWFPWFWWAPVFLPPLFRSLWFLEK